MYKRIVLGAIAALLVWTSAAQALLIELDFSTDTGGFFTTNPAAKLALEAAASDLSNLIITPLNATVDSNVGMNNTSTVTFNHSFNIDHPTTGAEHVIDSAVVPADVVRIFAGAQNLMSLGVGGPGGAGFSGSSLAFPDELQVAVNNAAAASHANLTRGGGPVIGTIAGTFDIHPFSYDFGLGIGGIAFDTDAAWHFDHTTAVAPGTSDFYSVALHELLHALGIGSSNSWDSLLDPADNNDWLGPNVLALLGPGSGEDLIYTGDFSHIAEGIMSNVFGVGTPQEAAMDPNLTTGTRKFITELDVAFLQDIGWNVETFSVIPEPASFTLFTGAALVLLSRRPKRR